MLIRCLHARACTALWQLILLRPESWDLLDMFAAACVEVN